MVPVTKARFMSLRGLSTTGFMMEFWPHRSMKQKLFWEKFSGQSRDRGFMAALFTSSLVFLVMSPAGGLLVFWSFLFLPATFLQQSEWLFHSPFLLLISSVFILPFFLSPLLILSNIFFPSQNA